mgnify:CR=1 FL=1
MKERTPRQMIVEKALNKLGFQTELEVLFPPFQADIVCYELGNGGVIFEIDGEEHRKRRDNKRDEFIMNKYGITRIIRVPNEIVDEGSEKLEKYLKEQIQLGE